MEESFTEAELIEGFKKLGWVGLFAGAEQEVGELVAAMREIRRENNGG
jgi:hypothetical protein